MSRISSVILAFAVMIVLASCDKKSVFDQYKSVGTGWHKDSIVNFEFANPDTTKSYNFFLNIRDNHDYPFNNIFVIVSMENPGGATNVDTLQYQMADPEGNLLGNGFTDIKESKLVYKERMRLKSGTYKVHVRQVNRQTGKVAGVEKLEGITEVGFRIEKE